MKIKTLEKLQDLLSQDMAWRKKELIDIKLFAHTTNNPLFCRMGIALLSAHFEGFIRQAANYYIIYISDQHIKLSKLHTNFTAIIFRKNIERCIETKNIPHHKKIVDSLLDKYNTATFKVRYSLDNPIITTDSNPSSVVFNNIVNTIGLDFAAYETKRNYIDTDLLSNRHGIVHGEKMNINISEFDNTLKIILDIMEQFSNEIIDAAVNKRYLK